MIIAKICVYNYAFTTLDSRLVILRNQAEDQFALFNYIVKERKLTFILKTDLTYKISSAWSDLVETNAVG